MLTERQFDSGTVLLNYAESEGPRPPLVLLHGKTLWWKYFLPVQEPIRSHQSIPTESEHDADWMT